MTSFRGEAPSKQEAKEILTRGLNKIRTKGWCQNILVNEAGAYCIIGCIDEEHMSASFALAIDTLIHLLKSDGNLAVWNDAKGRTQQEVEELLQEGIDKLS